ncbi:reverse transcriptase domain-containing protein [Tanacetum coccineum]
MPHPGQRNPLEKPRVKDRSRDGDGNVFSRLGHRRQSAFGRLSDTYSPSTTKFGLDRTSSRDHSQNKGRPYRRDSPPIRGRSPSKDRSRGDEESYDNTYSSYRTESRHGHRSRDRGRSRIMKRGRTSKSSLSRISEIGTNDGGRWKSASKRRPRGSWTARVWFDELPPESIDGYKDLKAAFLAYFMQQKKYVKDLVEIHNIKQRDGETLEDFMEHFKLTKRLNEHVPKTMEEMMTVTTAFIRGETAAISKKKGHAPWKLQDQSKRHVSKWKSDFEGDIDHSTKAWMNFMIVRSLSPYNGIIGRPGIREIRAVPSTAHGMLKFSVDGGIVTIRSTILIPAECATVTTSSKEILKEAEVRHENLKVVLHPNFPDQEVAIGGTLSEKGRTELCSLLKENLDIFAWQPSDMTGVPRSIAEHRLNIREGYTPVRQKKRGQAPERAKAIQAEVQKLVEAGIMREVHYHDWLSNPVMVKKHDGSWRMCVDFTDLNKACPQDCYPLPEIDWKVESLCGYPFKCFLDAYKGYHQIQMAESDEEKTAFHTSQGVYCYTKMPFGLKNAGATYQRLVDKAFNSQVGQNVEVYVDDLVIKSYTEAEMLRPQGIKPCPDKTEAVLQLPSPRTIKEKCIKKSDFHWTPEAEQAFKQLKQHLLGLPLLCTLKPKGRVIDTLSASYGAVSAVLMTERGTVQTQVYFVSRALQGPELNYAPMEKLVLALVFAAKRLRRYFQAHPIVVITDQPIKQIISHLNAAGQLQKWSVMLGEHNITYRPRTSVKGQILADFLVEKPDEAPPDTSVEVLIAGTSDDKKEVSKLRIKARQYELVEGVLYRRSFLTPWLRCVGLLQVDYVIREIHEGSCSMHAGPRSVVAKAMRLGYYWPTMHRDAREMIRACNDCQVHHPVPRNPQQPLTPITAPWPFYKWGIDIAGPFPEGPGKVKKFVWDNIVCHFGLPIEIVSDNGKQFSDNPFKNWCEKLNIIQRFASVKHPQSNGLVERANRSLGEGIKARLGEGNKNWIEELPHVLWAHRTMIKSSHGDTPFSLTYGTEAVIPVEIGMPTYRIATMDAVHNNEELRLNLDLLEERRKRAAIREAKAKLKMIKYYNARVRGVAFRPGDFVYRSNEASHAMDGGKLGPKWEGPYEVTEALGDGAYRLRSLEGTVLPRTWNIANLKKCYL